jgi:hypothetical protein
MPGALRPPAVRAYLHHHPPAALSTEPWRLQTELGGHRHGFTMQFTGVDVVDASGHQGRLLIGHRLQAGIESLDRHLQIVE